MFGFHFISASRDTLTSNNDNEDKKRFAWQNQPILKQQYKVVYD